MASEQTTQPVNGNFGAPPPYNATELHVHSIPPAGSNGANNPVSTGTAQPAEAQAESPSKDEVGWYFVEQYYTTLSKNPEKLHLFYGKKSQFVSGVESAKVSVSVGQRAISDRIKEMGVEECKVRVTNVDSQESHDRSIVVQVIGEMSNKNEPHKKFVQTFVLAKQANGYFVLNDIFRHIAEYEEDEEELEEPADEVEEAMEPPAPETQIKTLTSSDDLAAQAKDAEIVDQKLEQSKGSQPAALSAAVVPVAVPEVIRASSQKADSQKDVGEADQVSDGIEIEPDHPKDPEPTPAPPSPTQPEAAPAKEATPPPKPAAPKTWASMLASGAAKAAAPAAAAVSAPSSSQTPSVQQKKAPSATATAAVPAAPAVAAPQVSTSDTQSADEGQPLPSPGGWQTAGQEHNRKQKANAVSANATRDGSIKAYVKNVTERVDGPTLKSTLAKYGKIEYFDISRQKNCAFVEFADLAGFNAAVAANPHVVSGEDIYVEERHVRQQPYGQGFNPRGGRGGMRGGMDGRSNSQGGRGGFNKEGGRGNFPPRGRGGGGSMTPRGRGMPQAA